MSEQMIIMIGNLVAKVGLDAAISIIDGIKNAKTIDDAIAALKKTQAVTWDDFKKAPVT